MLRPSPFGDLDPELHALPPELHAEAATPALVIYLDHVRENLRRVLRALDGRTERWRPHLKTTKIPEVWDELLRAGLRRFKCATTREARCMLELLAARGLSGDLLVAYPLVGPALARLDRLAAEHSRVRLSVLCEDVAGVADVPPRVGIHVDVDPGMRRTGIPLEDHRRVLEVARAAGERLRGIHCYEGHLRCPDPVLGRDEAFRCYGRLIELVRALRRAGVDPPQLVTSGTPTFLHALEHAGLSATGAPEHQVSPGTVVLHDGMSEEVVGALGLVPAAVVRTRVVSLPGDDLVTCDAGSKALAAEQGDPCATVLGRPDLVAGRPSEEHLPLRCAGGSRPQRGSVLQLVPRHVCPTVNLAERALLVEDGRVRGAVPVRARAHDPD